MVVNLKHKNFSCDPSSDSTRVEISTSKTECRIRASNLNVHGMPIDSKFDLDLREGSKLLVTSGNAAARNTTLRTLVGLLPPAKGKVEVTGEIFVGLNPNFGVFRKASLLENIRHRGILLGCNKKQQKQYLESVLSCDGIEAHIDQVFSELSVEDRVAFHYATLKDVQPKILCLESWVASPNLEQDKLIKSIFHDLVERSSIALLGVKNPILTNELDVEELNLGVVTNANCKVDSKLVDLADK